MASSQSTEHAFAPFPARSVVDVSRNVGKFAKSDPDTSTWPDGKRPVVEPTDRKDGGGVPIFRLIWKPRNS